MTAIMIYHIKSKYTAVGTKNIQASLQLILGRKEMVNFFYLYFVAVVLDLLLVSNIIPFTSGAYTVL